MLVHFGEHAAPPFLTAAVWREEPIGGPSGRLGDDEGGEIRYILRPAAILNQLQGLWHDAGNRAELVRQLARRT